MSLKKPKQPSSVSPTHRRASFRVSHIWRKVIIATVVVLSLAVIVAFVIAKLQPTSKDIIDLSRYQAPCGQRATITPGASATERLRVDGDTRSYVLHLPMNYSSDTQNSLILAFHGKGASGGLMERFTGFSSSDAIVVYPNAMGGADRAAWQSAPYAPAVDDVHFVRELIATLKHNYCIDNNRIFAAGISNGGGFTSLLSCELPGQIAAFAVVAGAFYKDASASCPDAPPVPIIAFNGDADQVIRYGGGVKYKTNYEAADVWLKTQALRNHCAPTPLVTTIEPDILKSQWTQCTGQGALVQYRVKGGGHTWPGATTRSGPGATTKTISATKLILDFFKEHPAKK